MPSDSKFTRDDDGNVAVRVVSNTGVSEQPESMFTTDEDGNVAVRVVFGEGGGGGGGSDQHNLGWYATQAALEEAHPTAEAGDWAIVGATDTVWIWDTDNSEWVDSDQKGQVTSVNGQTGAVTISADDIITAGTGIDITNDTISVASPVAELVAASGSSFASVYGMWAKTTTVSPFRCLVLGHNAYISSSNASGAVVLGAEAVGGNGTVTIGGLASATVADGIAIGNSAKSTSSGAVQIGYGTNSTSNTFQWKSYRLVSSDGTIPEARLADTTNAQEGDVLTLDSNGNAVWQASSGGGLPDQTGQSGKFLTTDGTDASWSDKPLVNIATQSSSLSILGNAATGVNSLTMLAKGAGIPTGNGVVILNSSFWSNPTSIGFISIGTNHGGDLPGNTSISIKGSAKGHNSIQLGSGTNSDANTFKVGNANGNYEIMSADGSIPSDRLIHAINKYSTMPTAASTNEGWIVQFTGTTDSTYTHGHLYECVSDGQDPATYSWTEVSLGGGGSSYTAGTGIDITNGVISVTSPTITNNNNSVYTIAIASGATASNNGSAVGYNCKATGGFAAGNGSQSLNGVGIGYMAKGTEQRSIALGYQVNASGVGSIQLGDGLANNGATNSDANTFKVANANGNFEIMSADGTIPTARLTKVNSTITLTAAGWSSNTQTVNVTGMTADGVVFPCPIPADQADYTSAGILCTAQAAGTLTFTCDTAPSGDIDVNVVML